MAESWPGARKLCLFYRLWQLTGYWEQGPNDTATQQISTSSASCSFEQIRPLPPLRHNRAATAKQPPAKRAPTLLQPQNFLVWSFSGPQLHQGVLPQSLSPPRPQLARCVYFRWANIATCLRVQWPALSGGGLRIAPACFATGVHVASHSNRSTRWVRGILQAQLASANQTYLYSSSAFSQTGKPFPAFISSLHCFYNKRMSWCPHQPPHT